MNEDNLLDEVSVKKSKFINDFLKPLFKLLFSLLMAMVGSSFVGIILLFIGFLFIATFSAFENSFSEFIAGFFIIPIFSLFFTFYFGIAVPLFSAFQIILFGTPIALLGWKLKVINWKSCSIVGFFLASFPWAEFSILMLPSNFSSPFPPNLSELVTGIVLFFALGLCGSVGGLSFWYTLKLFRFQDVN